VVTVPHDLNGVFLQNRALLYNILFKSAAKMLRDVAKSRLGGTLGFFSVLHSWGKQLEFHPHLHIVVPKERRNLAALRVTSTLRGTLRSFPVSLAHVLIAAAFISFAPESYPRFGLPPTLIRQKCSLLLLE